jgi:hypothetical protein
LRQRPSSVPTRPPPTTMTSVTAAAENSAGSHDDRSNTIAAWPPPSPPVTNSNVFGDPPMGTVTATAPSSTSSNNIVGQPAGQPLAADEGKVGPEPAPEDEANAGPIQQQPTSDDGKSENDFTVVNNKDSYNVISLAMLVIIAAGFIFVGIMLNRTLMRLRKAATVEAALPALAENTQTSEEALWELVQILNTNPTKLAAPS